MKVSFKNVFLLEVKLFGLQSLRGGCASSRLIHGSFGVLPPLGLVSPVQLLVGEGGKKGRSSRHSGELGPETDFTLMEATTVRADAISTDTSNGDLTIGTQGTGNIVVDTGVIARTGDLELDVSGNLYLDADGGTMFLQDGTAGTFGQFIRAGSNDLTIASGSTQALIFTGANAAFQGNVTTAGTVGTSQISMEGNRIKTTASNADLQLETAGTGLIDLETPTQMTVGAVGAATHLPLDSANEIRPVGYLRIKISGTEYVIPYFNAS